jgi:hypothetical protein
LFGGNDVLFGGNDVLFGGNDVLFGGNDARREMKASESENEMGENWHPIKKPTNPKQR